MPRHLLTGRELGAAELAALIERAVELKRDPEGSRVLAGRAVGLIFERPSTRTRVSFEVGVVEMGGHPLILRPDEMQLGRGEPLRDTALVLSRHLAAVGVRTGPQSTVEALAEHGSIPVCNMLTSEHHPCQALADLLTLRDRFGSLEGRRLAYIGDGNNVAASLAYAAALSGLELAVASPAGFELPDNVIDGARNLGGTVEQVSDPYDAARGADALYTDVWTSMGQEDERAARLATFAGYTVDDALVAAADPGACFLHCLPAHRGEEVAASVIDGPASLVWEQAANRLHVARAALVDLLEEG
jgi:ornithine carbamoyltransferase